MQAQPWLVNLTALILLSRLLKMNTPTNSVHRCHMAILETSVNAANAYISKYGKPSKDMGRLINQQMLEFASHHGSQAAAELAGMITDWKIQPILRESMQNIQAKYASFSPFLHDGYIPRHRSPRRHHPAYKRSLRPPRSRHLNSRKV